MEVTENKFMDVIIDCKLSSSPHIKYLSKKNARSARIILKSRELFDQWPLLLTWFNFNPSMDK